MLNIKSLSQMRLKNYAKCKDKYNAIRNFKYHNDLEFRQKNK